MSSTMTTSTSTTTVRMTTSVLTAAIMKMNASAEAFVAYDFEHRGDYLFHSAENELSQTKFVRGP